MPIGDGPNQAAELIEAERQGGAVTVGNSLEKENWHRGRGSEFGPDYFVFRPVFGFPDLSIFLTSLKSVYPPFAENTRSLRSTTPGRTAALKTTPALAPGGIALSGTWGRRTEKRGRRRFA